MKAQSLGSRVEFSTPQQPTKGLGDAHSSQMLYLVPSGSQRGASLETVSPSTAVYKSFPRAVTLTVRLSWV